MPWGERARWIAACLAWIDALYEGGLAVGMGGVGQETREGTGEGLERGDGEIGGVGWDRDCFCWMEAA